MFSLVIYVTNLHLLSIIFAKFVSLPDLLVIQGHDGLIYPLIFFYLIFYPRDQELVARQQSSEAHSSMLVVSRFVPFPSIVLHLIYTVQNLLGDHYFR